MNQPNKTFDALLVLESQSGNKRAMTLLVKRWHPKLYKQAYWYTKDSDEAKDIVQDSWTVILRKIHFLNDPNSFGSWAIKITTRKSIDWLRKRKREHNSLETRYDIPNSITGGDGIMADKPMSIVVQSAIKELPDKQQIVLRLFYLEAFSINQISEILSISTGTVKSRLFTAREKLKTILKSRDNEK